MGLRKHSHGTAFAMLLAMTNTSLPRSNALQSIGMAPANPHARSAAPNGSSAPPTALAGSPTAPFNTVLAAIQTSGHPAPASAASGALPLAVADAPLSTGTAGEIVSNSDESAVNSITQTKAQTKPSDALKGAPSRVRQAVPDANGLPIVANPATTVPSMPAAAPVAPKVATGSPVAASSKASDGEVLPTSQTSAAFAAEPEAPALGETPLGDGKAGPAANTSLPLSVTLPKLPAANDAAGPSQAGTASALGMTAPNASQAAAATAAAKPAVLQPSQQVTPALVQLTHTSNGGQLTLQLNPGELGRVHIQIDRAADGSANVQVTADRAETLQLLVADQAQLHHALDSAGLPHEGRTLNLSLAEPETDAGQGFNGGGANGGNNSAAGERSNGQQGRSSSRNSDDETGTWIAGTRSATSSILTTNRLRAGVDITA